MRKKVGIITQSAVRNFYKDKLDRLLGAWFDFAEYSLDEFLYQPPNVALDAAMFNVYSHYRMVSSRIPSQTQIIIIDLTISCEAYQTLKRVKDHSKVLYVNLNRAMAMDSILLFQNLGLTHLDYALYYPGKKHYPRAKTIITNGESQYAPPGAERVIDLGHREISPQTVVELLTKLNRRDLLQEEHIQAYFRSVMVCESGLESLLDRSGFMERQLDELMQLIEKGVIFADKDFTVIRINGAEEVCLGRNRQEIVGKKLTDLIQDADLCQCLLEHRELSNHLLQVNGLYYSVSVHPLYRNGEYVGALLLTEDFVQNERRQNRLKSQLVNNIYRPRYGLDNMLGDSQVMVDQRRMIHRFSLSAVPVLITGETGTGKEVAAQAIHNLSARRSQNFVAINCAAVPQNLLESELFGYERGAFTGASKEGKAGKFELADNGTLFLDEIGDLPFHLQGRLLRAIQEKEIVRLGGERVIHTDCRIIAATNKDLFTMVQKNRFRADLYYRLNALPLHLAPLRAHPEDIPMLTAHFQEERGYHFVLAPDAVSFLLHYPWYGNVRELINCVDYLGNLYQPVISAADLPDYMAQEASLPAKDGASKAEQPEQAILLALLEAKHQHRRLGRRSLCQSLERWGYYFTEHELRTTLIALSARKLVQLNSGRAGTVITQQGEDFLQRTNR